MRLPSVRTGKSLCRPDNLLAMEAVVVVEQHVEEIKVAVVVEVAVVAVVPSTLLILWSTIAKLGKILGSSSIVMVF